MTSLFSPESLRRVALDARQAESFRSASTKRVLEDYESGWRLTYYRLPDGCIMIDSISPIPSSFPYL